jgi:hypothetical protein
MIKKAPLIRALKQVASEYNNNSHKLKMHSCAMCELYRSMFLEEFYGYTCGECPMAIAFKACGRRQCAPVECRTRGGNKIINKEHLNELEAVTEFFYKVIKRVQRMTVAELNAENAWDFMIQIDHDVAKKYGITNHAIGWD